MTLKKLRNISFAVSVTALLLIAVALLWTAREVEHALSINRTAEGIRDAIHELNYVAVDTILHYEERSQRQWRIKHRALSAMLAGLQLGPEYQNLVEVTRKSLARTQTLYPELLVYHRAAKEKAIDQTQFREVEARIVSRLLGQFQDMNSNAARIGELSMNRITSAQRVLGGLIIAFITAISAIVAVNWMFISRKVLAPVGRLQKGTEVVASGNLGYRAGFSSRDEIGSLARAFDAMTEKIQQSLEQLEAEIRERILAEQELLESREQIRAVTETARDAIISADAAGHIVHTNQGAERLFGYSANEMAGMILARLIPERHRAGANAVLRKLLVANDATATDQTFELNVVRKDGRELPVELSLAAWTTSRGRFFTAIVRDITTRKVAEERLRNANEQLESRVAERTQELATAVQSLRESERHYRMLFEFNPHPMWVYDIGTMSFLAVNNAAIAHYGYTREEFLHMTIEDLMPQEERAHTIAHWRRLDLSQRQEGVYRHIRKNGDFIDVAIIADAIDFSGQPARLVLSLDITESLRAKEKIEQLNADLERRVAERTKELEKSNDELEAFSYSVSHDLRAPLRHINGFVALFQDECGAAMPSSCREYLDFISESATQMGNLIDDLLTFSRFGRTDLRRSRFSMSDVVQEVLAQMASETQGRNIEFRIEALPEVWGDRSMFRQVWANLLSNAIKYTRPRPVAIIEIGCQEQGDKMEFWIRDNGVGFDMKFVGQLFGVFHRLHRAEDFEGTGVGLANVRRIIQRHGGHIRAEGEADHGATFYFTLPNGDNS